MTATIDISIKTALRNLVISAMDRHARGMATLSNWHLNDNEMNQVEFDVTVTLKKVTDPNGNTVFLNEIPIAEKRVQFQKDLDKLVSGDYVLVPKNDLNKG